MEDRQTILIRGGRVIDPANGVDETADVLIQSGKIAAIGRNIEAEDARIFDAAGRGSARPD